MSDLVVLYRPVGGSELDLIERSGFREFPARLPEQPIFYPVTNEEYATQIARDGNAKHNPDRKGYVTRFKVRRSFIETFETKIVGSSIHEEYWIPAERLSDLNANIVGLIELISAFESK